MWTLTPPTDRQLLAVRLRQARLPLSHPHTGCTHGTTPPPGYVCDQHRVKLGGGDEVFAAASDALRRWAQFPPGWVRLDPTDAPIREGTVVTISARVCGVWWVNACRVVEVIDEPGRFGFAYGTLPGHAELGEERFLVERDADGGVWYTILAHSRPRLWLARLLYPLTRRTQKRFARDSMAAMVRAVIERPPVATGGLVRATS
jgi:uncharacterized protein (UPF0548 family)